MNIVLRERVEKHLRLMASNNDYTIAKEKANLHSWLAITGYSESDIERAKEAIQ